MLIVEKRNLSIEGYQPLNTRGYQPQKTTSAPVNSSGYQPTTSHTQAGSILKKEPPRSR